MIKIKPGKNLKLYALLVVSLLIFLSALVYKGYIYKIPRVGNYLLALKIEREANKYSSETAQYRRLKAIADALKKGKKEYHYERPVGPNQSTF